MSLENYSVARDGFEIDEKTMHNLCFPCNVCAHRDKSDRAMPCRKCDHNACADKDEEQ